MYSINVANDQGEVVIELNNLPLGQDDLGKLEEVITDAVTSAFDLIECDKCHELVDTDFTNEANYNGIPMVFCKNCS